MYLEHIPSKVIDLSSHIDAKAVCLHGPQTKQILQFCTPQAGLLVKPPATVSGYRLYNGCLPHFFLLIMFDAKLKSAAMNESNHCWCSGAGNSFTSCMSGLPGTRLWGTIPCMCPVSQKHLLLLRGNLVTSHYWVDTTPNRQGGSAVVTVNLMENTGFKHWENLERMTEALSRSLLVQDGNKQQANVGFGKARRLVRFLTSPNCWFPFTSNYILLQSQGWSMPVSNPSSLIFQNSGVLQLFLKMFCGAHHYTKGNCHRITQSGLPGICILLST